MNARTVVHLQFCLAIILFFVASITTVHATDSTNVTTHLIVSYPSGDRMLLGYLYRPSGTGPFPGVVFHHIGSTNLMAQDVKAWQEVATLLTSHGYMVFVPDRHANNLERQEYSPALQAKLRAGKHDAAVKGEMTIEREDLIHRDVTAALAWFRRQPELDTNRIAIAGQLGGAIHTLYEADQLTGVRGLVAFSPGVVSWSNSTVVRGMLIASIRKATAPIFLLYTENQNQEPAEALGPELDRKGPPNRLKVYPAPKVTDEGLTASSGLSNWGADVLSFLAETMK